ncbi:nuclear pore complex protein Nup133 [Frieseomelitta varia]|uniref:nuclear pore complex protein Nup133 n=1 Tax=Frieseomelitta varia TaxID=561572 RepID=UPI001CB6AFCD|nr:nuclear pore complex protein Nup133 [Frieseomelitta varia]XP_043529239.1 nuclear pore complex protein Nup133 [Frieseomelitta varia]XP_043529240.1 nuclear pore complex protein Nup133 [Frieseomelitta varia]
MDRTGIGNSLGRNLMSPRKRMSIVQSLKKSNSAISVSGRSNQSVQIICKTASHVVESFGSSLPVLVTEALTFVDKNTAVSVNISIDGWAWLVCGRRLLVWQCKTTIHDSKQRRTFKSQCRELLLPQSDLAHKAECIAVWLPQGHQVPSCMAVSPEGIVRFWVSVAHEGSSVETSAELAGQEVDCLTYIPGHGCILATTTCTVALLQPQFVGGKNSVNCQVLRTSQGWLGGIGRRMTSLIFGAIPQSPVTETKLVKVTCTTLGDRGSRVLILAGSSLQYWSFLHNEQEKMEFDEDIGYIISQAFQRKIWKSSVCNPQNMETWLIDMQPCNEGIVFLMAAHCADASPLIEFALGLIQLSGTTLANTFKWFIPVKIDSISYHNDAESTLVSYRFILCGWEAIIYNQYEVLVVNCISEHEQDKIDLVRGGEDSILGGALCSGTPVLFTKNFGLVSVMPSDFMLQDFNMSYTDNVTANVDYTYRPSSAAQNFTSLISNEEIQNMYYSSDSVTQLRAAFLFSLRQNEAQCDEILLHLFPLQDEPIMDIDATLDTLILKVAKDLIDDYPANDPRWSNHRDLSMTINAVTSMQIPNQLEGKQKAIDLFITFLKEHDLWNRFCAVTYRGIIMSTPHVLGEYAEKIVAALTIYNLQNKYPDIVDTTIEQTLNPESYVSDELTARDIFYREVSAVHQFLPTLVNNASEVTQSERPIQQVANYIMQVNAVLLGILHEVVKYRQHNAERFVPTRCSNGITEYLPWTAAIGKHGLKNCLTTMYNLTLKHGITGTNDSTVRNELYEQLVSYIDLILDGRKCHLESVKGTEKFEVLLKQYETDRMNLIQPLIKEEQYDSAAMLAEKYCDFASLIQICELTNNKNQLDGYMKKFAAQDFVGFLFSWYVKDGRQGQLVEKCRRGGTVELSEKLAEHPTLSWVQSALTDDLCFAASTLYSLAIQESELVTRKKSMLSLAKLAFLASDELKEKDRHHVKNIDNELALVAYQEELPTQVLTTYGYDVEKLRVFTPTELITLYTSEDNIDANEYDFKKALDLLEYVEQEDEKVSLKLQTWARAAKRDQWDTLGKNPEQQVQETIFFKLMDLAHFTGGQVNEFLPPVDMLLIEPELGNLAASSNFQFLIKFVYEYAYSNY